MNWLKPDTEEKRKNTGASSFAVLNFGTENPGSGYGHLSQRVGAHIILHILSAEL